MSGIFDWYLGQKVTEGELDAAFAALEQADRDQNVDLGLVGIFSGLSVAQHNAGDLTVDVTAGRAGSKAGERLKVPSTQNVDLSADYLDVTTAVAANPGYKIVSVFLQFDRAVSDPRTDGNGDPVNFVRAESFTFKIIQGAESATLNGAKAAAAALQSDGILLADCVRSYGSSTILTAGIYLTDRREDWLVVAGTTHSLRRGLISSSLDDLLGWLDDHLAGSGDLHAASVVNYAGGGSWAGGTSATNPAATVEAQFDKIITDLSATTAGASGAHRIGSAALVGTSGTIAAGTLASQLLLLKSAGQIEYAGSGLWQDGNSIAATHVEGAIDTIVSSLAATTGAAKIGLGTRTAWLGGRLNGGMSVFSAVDKIITDLAVNNDAADDGAERIGFTPSGKLVADNVGAAVRELDGRTPGVGHAAYAYSTRAGTINSYNSIQSWANTSLSATINGLKTGDVVMVIASFGIGGTPLGAYSLRLAAAGLAIDGTEVDAEMVSTFTLQGAYTIPSDGNYTFTVQYQNPSTAMATMTILGSASLIALPIR